VTATSSIPASRVQTRIAHPLFAGTLTDVEASARNCTLVRSSHGVEGTDQHVELGLLVDATGTVRDARVRTGARDALAAGYDVMAELAVGRRLDDLKGITPRLVDAKLREPAGGAVLNLAQDPDQPFYVLVKAAERGAPVLAATTGTTADALPWSEVGLFEKVRRIEAVLDQHVRPALANDGGGIDLVDLQGDELSVQYQGACGSCGSSVGGTLQFVQDSLNNHLNTTLTLTVLGYEDSMMPIGH
jgi:NifU-like protein